MAIAFLKLLTATVDRNESRITDTNLFAAAFAVGVTSKALIAHGLWPCELATGDNGLAL